MVFRGRPSSYCGLCRKRKIKCDQARPECSQCVRVKAPCSGYRDVQGFIFRDQTSSIYRRAGRAAPAEGNHVPYGLQQSEDDLAVAYFYAQYVTADDNFSPIQMDLIPQIAGTKDATLPMASITCIGMALMANIKKSAPRALAARQKYTNILSLIRAALENPSFAGPGTVLASVLFLAMFETVCTTSVEDLQAWCQHLEGALCFLNSLDSDLISAEVGVYTIFYLKRQLLLSHIQRQSYAANSMSDFVDKSGVMVPPEMLLYSTLTELLSTVITLQTLMEDTTMAISTEQIMHTLINVNNELETWGSHLSDSDQVCCILPCIPDNNFYGSFYYFYPSYRDATIRNEYSTVRILASDLLLKSLDDALHSIDQDTVICQALRNKALHTFQTECNSVCANAPYFLGRVERSPMSSRTLGSYYFQWSLYTCARLRRISDHQRSWANGQLRAIGHEMGINLALVLAKLSETSTR